MQGPTSDGHATEAPPQEDTAPSAVTAPPGGLPMMFNPNQFTAPTAAPSTGGRLKYGQRRAYPK